MLNIGLVSDQTSANQTTPSGESQFMTDLKKLKDRKEALLRSKGYTGEPPSDDNQRFFNQTA